MKRIGRAALVALVLLGALAGCGISAEDQPRALGVSATPTTPEPVQTTLGDGSLTTIYLVFSRAGTLRPVQRLVANDDPTPAELLQALQDDVSSSDTRSGLTTGVIDAAVLPNAAGAPASLVTVQVPDDLLTSEPLAFGQIVLTLTRLSAVEQVQFVRNGAPIDVPDAAGTVLQRPAVRTDYTALLA